MNADDIHELITLLKTELEAGRVKLNSRDMIISLKKIRMGPNGKIDPATVDGAVRAMALAVAAGKDTRERKRLSLKEIQAAYFESLSEMFGPLFDEMKRWNATPQIIAEQFASKKSAVDAFEQDLPEFASAIKDFWTEHGPTVQEEIRRLKGLKSVFGGDLFPSYVTNIACSVGLYVDTIVLPDPLLRILDLLRAMPPRQIMKFTVKHALNALQYKDLALADVAPPIVVIAPDFRFGDSAYRTALTIAGEADLVVHAGKIFGRQFSDVSDVRKFLEERPDPAILFSQIKDHSRVLFDTAWSGSFAQQIEQWKNEFAAHGGSSQTVPETLYSALFGRMGQANDILFRSNRYNGTPLVDAPTSWQYLLWKYEYDGTRSALAGDHLKESLISKAIQVEGKHEFGMLGGVPSDTLIQLRKDGALATLRETLSKGIDQIDAASADMLREIANKVVENVDTAFTDHGKQLKELSSSTRKFYGFDVGRWIVVGGLSVAAAAAGSESLGILAAASTAVLGTPAVPDLKKRWEELKNTKTNLQRSPTGLLFRHLKKKYGF